MSEVDIFRRVMRNDFAVFAKRSMAELKPALPLDWNWHHDLIADRLTRHANGQIARLLICVPPRGLKSLLCSVIYPAWLLGRNPAEQTLCVSYAQSLATDFAHLSRTLMESDFYRRAFHTRIASDRRAVHQFETTDGGRRIASSVGGTITGRGGNFIILDDPMKPKEALSENGRIATLAWLKNTLLSRSDNKLDERMLVIMQRLHQEDVAGHLLEQGGWETVILPAIAITDEEHHYHLAGRPFVRHRKAGEPLQLVREPLALLERLRKDMSLLTFAAQYQQDPLPVEGNLVRRSWIRYFEPSELGKPERIIQSWDTASKISDNCDYSACTTWAVRDGMLYTLDVWRGKVEMPDLCRKVIELAQRYDPRTVVIEDKGSGTGLLQALRAQKFYKAVGFSPKTEKLVRFAVAIPRFEGGHLRLPRRAPWLEDYISEICGFPHARNDDQVDSTSQAIAYIDTPMPSQGFFEWIESERDKSDD